MKGKNPSSSQSASPSPSQSASPNLALLLCLIDCLQIGLHYLPDLAALCDEALNRRGVAPLARAVLECGAVGGRASLALLPAGDRRNRQPRATRRPAQVELGHLRCHALALWLLGLRGDEIGLRGDELFFHGAAWLAAVIPRVGGQKERLQIDAFVVGKLQQRPASRKSEMRGER